MSNLRELKVVPKTESEREQEGCLESFEEKVKEAREFLKEHPDAGFGMICYAHLPEREHTTWASWRLAKGMDAYIFPQMAEVLFVRVRNECGSSGD